MSLSCSVQTSSKSVAFIVWRFCGPGDWSKLLPVTDERAASSCPGVSISGTMNSSFNSEAAFPPCTEFG